MHVLYSCVYFEARIYQSLHAIYVFSKSPIELAHTSQSFSQEYMGVLDTWWLSYYVGALLQELLKQSKCLELSGGECDLSH